MKSHGLTIITTISSKTFVAPNTHTHNQQENTPPGGVVIITPASHWTTKSGLKVSKDDFVPEHQQSCCSEGTGRVSQRRNQTCGATQYSLLHYTLLQYTRLHYSLLPYTLLHYSLLYYSLLHYTLLHYSLLQYTLLHYTLLQYSLMHY